LWGETNTGWMPQMVVMMDIKPQRNDMKLQRYER
jgi:hypothetical protein